MRGRRPPTSRRPALREVRRTRARRASTSGSRSMAADARSQRPASGSSTTCSRRSRSGRCIDIELRCAGDLWVDEHHTVEDCAIALGEALDSALGDRAGLCRFGDARAPLDEALAEATVDLVRPRRRRARSRSGRRPHRAVPTTLFPHFLDTLARRSRIGLHVSAGEGRPPRVEAAFKALALALRNAVARRPRARAASRAPRASCERRARRLRRGQPALAARGLRARRREVAVSDRPRRGRRRALRRDPGRRCGAPAMDGAHARGLVDAIDAALARRRPPVRRLRRPAAPVRALQEGDTPASGCCPAGHAADGRAPAAAHGLERRRARSGPPALRRRCPRPAISRTPTPSRRSRTSRARAHAVEQRRFASLVGRGAVAGMQFHPERSAAAGSQVAARRPAVGRCCVSASSRAWTSRAGASSRASTSSTCATAVARWRPPCATPSRAPTRSCGSTSRPATSTGRRCSRRSSAPRSRSTCRSRSAAG